MKIKDALYSRKNESLVSHCEKKEFLQAMGFHSFGTNSQTKQKGLTYYFTKSKSSRDKLRQIINKIRPYVKPIKDGYRYIGFYGSYDSADYLLGLEIKSESRECRVIKMCFGTDTVLKEFKTLTPAIEYAQKLAFEDKPK